MADVSAITVTLNGLPWIEQCLESVRRHEAIVVDPGAPNRLAIGSAIFNTDDIMDTIEKFKQI